MKIQLLLSFDKKIENTNDERKGTFSSNDKGDTVLDFGYQL